MNQDLEEEVLLLKTKLLKLEDTVNKLSFIKEIKIPLVAFAKELGITRQALTYHVKNNYKPQEDFYLENNKILLSVGILNSIKEYYNAK